MSASTVVRAAAAAPGVTAAAVVGAAVGLVAAVRTWRDRALLRRRCISPDGRSSRARRWRGGSRSTAPPDRTAPRGGGLVRDLWWAMASEVGSLVRRLIRRPADPEADARAGAALLAGAFVLVAGGGSAGAVVAAFVTWALPLVRRVRRRTRDRSAVVDELPEVVDLIRLGVGSGLNVRLALEAVVRHRDGRIADAFGEVLTRVGRGERLADALDVMGAAHDAVGPLVDALVATERYGAPLVSALDRVASEARTARRRRREEAARRVPVKLLFPLVFCTLPAFVLLTVVPVLVRSLPSLAP